MAWIAEHIWTCVIILILAAAVTAIVWKLIRDKRKGKTSCGCHCAHCAMSASCHAQPRKDQESR